MFPSSTPVVINKRGHNLVAFKFMVILLRLPLSLPPFLPFIFRFRNFESALLSNQAIFVFLETFTILSNRIHIPLCLKFKWKVVKKFQK